MQNKNNKKFKYPPPRTISEFIYQNLKEDIMNNEFKAHQRINEKEISEIFHVSRTPVREAVLRLAAEGFVKIDSYRRAVVKELTFEELSEIIQVLAVLDKLAIELVIDNLSSNEIQKLEKITNKMENYCSQNSVEKFMDLNVSFHNELWKYVPNKFLREMLYQARDHKERYTYARLYSYKKLGTLEKSMKQHRELMKAIKERDKERSKELIVKHRNLLLESAKDKEKIKKYMMAE
ncbi:GntR family transcriptional regulator [bacterium]|nr:GntR family transcriptional regulator [bacterium]